MVKLMNSDLSQGWIPCLGCDKPLHVHLQNKCPFDFGNFIPADTETKLRILEEYYVLVGEIGHRTGLLAGNQELVVSVYKKAAKDIQNRVLGEE